jgi:hypothetical protein
MRAALRCAVSPFCLRSRRTYRRNGASASELSPLLPTHELTARILDADASTLVSAANVAIAINAVLRQYAKLDTET